MHPAKFYANQVDYFRILALVFSIFTAKAHPLATVFFFALSDMLDMADGFLARKLGQTSFLGSVLDMAVDRTSSTIITLQILRFSSNELITVVLSIFVLIDNISHWLRYSYGAKFGEHHKLIISKYKLLNFYYQCKPFLTLECTAYEVCLISMYAYHACSGLMVVIGKWAAIISTPFTVLKVWISILQAVDAVDGIGRCEEKLKQQHK